MPLELFLEEGDNISDVLYAMGSIYWDEREGIRYRLHYFPGPDVGAKLVTFMLRPPNFVRLNQPAQKRKREQLEAKQKHLEAKQKKNDPKPEEDQKDPNMRMYDGIPMYDAIISVQMEEKPKKPEKPEKPEEQQE